MVESANCVKNENFKIQGNSSCVDDEQGKYNDKYGSTSNLICILCHNGTFSVSVNLINISLCLNMWRWFLSEREGAILNTACIPCEPGKYSTILGMSSNNLCASCSKGKFSNVSVSQKESQSKSCQAGNYSDKGGMIYCKSWKQGTFSDSFKTIFSATCLFWTCSTRRLGHLSQPDIYSCSKYWWLSRPGPTSGCVPAAKCLVSHEARPYSGCLSG